MTLISSTIPNLINGISQQPHEVRQSSQAEEQLNGYSSVAHGLVKRPPFEVMTALTSLPSTGDTKVHMYERDANEQYLVTVQNETLKVFDFAGKEKTVTFPDGTDYLKATKARSVFKLMTIADHTFVLNTETTVLEKEDGTIAALEDADEDGWTDPEDTSDGVVFIKAGAYATTYDIYMDDKLVATHKTSKDKIEQVSTTYIVDQLVANFGSTAYTASYVKKVATTYPEQRVGKGKWKYITVPATGTAPVSFKDENGNLVVNLADKAYTLKKQGNLIRISATDTDNKAFKLRVEDTQGNTHSVSFKQEITDFYDLPPKCFDDYTVKVIGDKGNEADDYYVMYNAAKGLWEETRKPLLRTILDASTLPHKLVSEADGTFTFQQIEWGRRDVGDLDSAPAPSFVDKEIKDIFFYKDRLGMLAEEGVILSEVGEYYNFFPITVRASLDTRPLDITVADTKVAFLNNAVAFNGNLLAFSKYTQFAITSDNTFTAANIATSVLTRFESSDKAKPVGAGKNIFFPVLRGRWGGIREYYVDENNDSKDAADITAHVPTFIDGEVIELVSSSNEDIVICTTDNEPSKLFIYSYFWKGSEKVQSSWSVWQTEGDVIGLSFIKSDLLAVIKREDGMYLEKLRLAGGEEALEAGYSSPILLDRRVFLPSGSFLPYIAEGMLGITQQGTVVQGADAIQTYAGTDAICIGVPYSFGYTFSQQQTRQTNTTVPRKDGRLQLRSFSVAYSDTGFFEATVTPSGRDPSIHTFTGKVVGGISSILGGVGLSSGTFRFPVLSNAETVKIELSNNTHLPCQFQNVEWEGVYNSRAVRI